MLLLLLLILLLLLLILLLSLFLLLLLLYIITYYDMLRACERGLLRRRGEALQEEFARLAETGLAQSTLTYISIA